MRFMFQSCGMALLLVTAAMADQDTFNNSGGTVTLGADLVVSGSNLASPAGTVSMSCPVTSVPPGTYIAKWTCVGGSFTLQSSDGTTTLSGIYTSGTLTLTSTGGIHGVPKTYYYTFSGNFTGSLTTSTGQEAVTGFTTQALAGTKSELGTGTIGTGSTVINSQYEPLYVADTYNSRIIRMDDFTGDNWVTLGTGGSGVGQFSLPWDVFVDAAGKIYVTDYNNCRVVRVDDMTGANWTALGTCGSGANQFNDPMGLFVDSAGRIYVADTGNHRIVRMDDMTGANWITYATTGSGNGYLEGPTAVVLNPAGQIYIADTLNSQIIRIDDMTGANYTAFSGSGVNLISSPVSLSLDAAGRIYIMDVYANQLVRIDDMTGANWTTLGGAGSNYQFINPYAVYVDPYGVIYIADSRSYRLVRVDDMTGLAFTTYATGGTGVGGVDSPSGLFAVVPAVPTPVPVVSATSLSFGDDVVGVPTAAQTVTLANIGTAPLNVTGLAASGDFAETDNCTGSLAPGTSCSAAVTFNPTAGGNRSGSLTLNFASPASRSVALSGTGTLVAVAPASLNFGTVITDRHLSLTVTITNPGPNPGGITRIVRKGALAYRETNNCPNSLPSGGTCTVTVTFHPTETKYYKGTLVVTDASGTVQKVTLTGTGGGV